MPIPLPIWIFCSRSELLRDARSSAIAAATRQVGGVTVGEFVGHV